MLNVEPRRVLAPPLPSLTPRRSTAWTVSVLVHAAALGVGIWLVERTVTAPPPEPERMVFVEPAPPPPPPLGAPVSAASVPVAPQPVVERPKEIPQPQRLVVPRKPKRLASPLPTPAAIPRGEPEGSVGGVSGGVLGGEAGGKVGGVVGGHGDAPVPANAVEHPPVLVSRVLPVYPPMARARSIEGRVLLRAVIDRDGHVEEAITVVESEPVFDAAAVEALHKWRFEPGRDRDGRAVRVLVEVPIRFQLR
jgi:protein TonB